MKKSGKPAGGKSSGKGTRKRRSTVAQQQTQRNLARFSRMWSRLTEGQRTAWRHFARNVRSRTRGGHSHPLDGHKVFNKVNTVLARLEREPAAEPPSVPNFGLNPVLALRITPVGGRLRLTLVVKGTPAHEIMVFGSPPQSAGRGSCRDYRFLGLLPAPVESESDITRLYLRKFGVPPENSRVFIRAWQVENGWEDRGGMRLTSALLPI